MKVDYSKYPMIPPGCQMNFNRLNGTYQVFREGKNRSPWCTTKRESVGRIDADGNFTLSKLFQLNEKLHSNNQSSQPQPSSNEPSPQTPPNEASATVSKVVDAVSAVVQKTQIDSRSSQTVTSIPMAALVLGALMQALTGDTDCVSIGDFVVRNREFFKRYIPDCSFEHVSHDTVRRSLMLIAPERFEKFYLKILEPLVAHTVADVVAVDGQAVRASAKTSKDNDTLHEPSMIMNVFDVGNRVCLAQRRIENKTNEITVGPQMIEDLDLWGTVVTADAMNCQVGFVQAVCRQADYCISLKGNQERSWKEAMYLFNTTDPSRIASHVGEWELDHGRIERRTISAISGRLLSEPIRKKWPGLTGGALVRVMTEKTKKSTGKQSVDVRYYITSLPGDEDSVERLGEVIRAH